LEATVHVIRLRTLLAVTAVALAALALTSTSASAQDYPPTPPTPSQACTPVPSASGPLLPGAVVNIGIACGGIEGGNSYTGILASTPITLPVTRAAADDSVVFTGVRLPADFELNARHTISLVDAGTGATLGSANFCVDGSGRITNCQTGTGKNIPRTGSDLTGPGLRIGAGLLAVGAGALVVSRRRKAAAGIAA
jgi:hypothetical protein